LPDLPAGQTDDSTGASVAGARDVDVALLDEVFADV
jgi:hypothetical protein